MDDFMGMVDAEEEEEIITPLQAMRSAGACMSGRVELWTYENRKDRSWPTEDDYVDQALPFDAVSHIGDQTRTRLRAGRREG